MGQIPAFLLRQLGQDVTVYPFTGTWGGFGSGVTIRAVVEEHDGGQRTPGAAATNTVTLVAALADAQPQGSRVTLGDGRKGYIASTARYAATGVPAPDHAQMLVVLAGTVGIPNGETVTLITRGPAGKDRYGNPRYGWTETTINGCSVQPTGSTEQGTATTDQVVTTLTVIMPPGTTVTAADRLRIRGLLYAVDGEPLEQTDPMTGAHAGMRVTVRRTEG